MNGFSDAAVTRINDALRKAIQKECAALDIDVDFGTMNYTSSEARMKITVRPHGVKEMMVQIASGAADIEVGKTKFRHGSTIFTLVDYIPSRRKYPFVGENSRGTRYKFTRQNVIEGKVA